MFNLLRNAHTKSAVQYKPYVQFAVKGHISASKSAVQDKLYVPFAVKMRRLNQLCNTNPIFKLLEKSADVLLNGLCNIIAVFDLLKHTKTKSAVQYKPYVHVAVKNEQIRF